MEVVRKRSGALHGVLCLGALVTAGLAAPPWPWHLVLPLLGYGGTVLAVPHLRHTAPRLAVGRLGGIPLACAATLSVATLAVLIGFHALARPDVTAPAARLPVAAFGSLILAGLCFSAANAALEELIFRGVLWGAVAEEWNGGVALIVTAVLFGLGHLHGYPPGPLGAVLAGLYGLALGLLRWWVGGMGLTIACHMCADATTFGLLWWSGAFGQTAA